MEHTFSHSYDTVFSKCKEALKSLDMDIDSNSKEEGIIYASTGTSLVSWGEKIKIKIKEVGAKKTKVVVESEAPSQLFSWGKNDKNENSIIDEISKKLKIS